MSDRLLVWRGPDEFRAEVAEVDLGPDSLEARGTQIGVEPVGYRLDYELSTGPRFVTARLEVSARGAGWSRRLLLLREEDGGWRVDAGADGDVDLPPPGGDATTFSEALDCDLGLCPLTNTMPVRREGLHEGGGELDFVMAWVSVPALEVSRSEQTYAHVRTTGDGAIVRYGGSHRGGTWEIDVDGDGLVRRYEALAERVFGG